MLSDCYFFLYLERLSRLDGFSFQDGFFFFNHCLCWLRTGPEMGGKVGEMVFSMKLVSGICLLSARYVLKWIKICSFFLWKIQISFDLEYIQMHHVKLVAVTSFSWEFGCWWESYVMLLWGSWEILCRGKNCSGGICFGVMLLGKIRFRWWLIGIALRCAG